MFLLPNLLRKHENASIKNILCFEQRLKIKRFMDKTFLSEKRFPFDGIGSKDCMYTLALGKRSLALLNRASRGVYR